MAQITHSQNRNTAMICKGGSAWPSRSVWSMMKHQPTWIPTLQNTTHLEVFNPHNLSHTCSETSLRIFVVECIARAQTIPTNWHERLVDSTRTSVRSMLSTSLLWGMFWCSMVNHQNRKIGRKWQLCRNENENRLAGSRLGRLPWTKMKTIEQVRGLSVPNPYHCATDASSLDGDIWSTLHPPAYMEWKSSRNYNKRTKQT